MSDYIEEGKSYICGGCGCRSAELHVAVLGEVRGETKLYYLKCGCNHRSSYYLKADELIYREFLVVRALAIRGTSLAETYEWIMQHIMGDFNMEGNESSLGELCAKYIQLAEKLDMI